MNRSLGMVLAVSLAGLQFLAVLAVVFSSYISSEHALLSHARSLLNDVGRNTIEHSRWFLQPARDAAKLAARLAENEVILSDNLRHLEQFLFQQLRLGPHFAGLYYGGRDGSFVYVMRTPDGPAPFRTKLISYPGGTRVVDLIWRDADFRMVKQQRDGGDTFDPRSRPWFKNADAARATVWTDPYIFYSSQQPGITLAAPVMQTDADDIRGVVGVDIEIGMLSEFLARLKIGKSGRALIINQNGDVIAHPVPDLIRSSDADGDLQFTHITDIDDPVARTAYSALSGAGDAPSEFTFNGKRFVAAFLPMPADILPWTIAVYAPEDDFIASIKRNRANNLWIAAAVALVTGGVGFVLAHRIHKPFREFALRSALLSRGELDPDDALPRTYHELERANADLSEQIVARRQSETQYRQTFQRAAQGMAHVAHGCRTILRVNTRLCEITGYSENELTGMQISDLAASGEKADWLCAIDGQDGATGHGHLRCRRKDGTLITILMNAILIHGRDRDALYSVVTMEDVTERLEAEEQIRQLSRDLSHLSRGNTMGQMAAGLAHELNQPLTAIAQDADTARLLLEQDPADLDALKQILSEISQQTLRSGEIIHALRSFIMRDSGQSSDFEFETLLAQSVLLLKAEATEADVTFDTEIETGLPRLEGNHVQVAQVLVNLLRNAVEALADSDIHDKRVVIRARAGTSAAIIEIEDNGPGISPDITLFTQFETSKPNGMGLGLSICRSIVEGNGGQLIHDALYQGGTRFRFTLPFAASYYISRPESVV